MSMKPEDGSPRAKRFWGQPAVRLLRRTRRWILASAVVLLAWWLFMPVAVSRSSRDGLYVATLHLPSRAAQFACCVGLARNGGNHVGMSVTDRRRGQRLAHGSRQLSCAPIGDTAEFGRIVWSKRSTRVAIVWCRTNEGGPEPQAWLVAGLLDGRVTVSRIWGEMGDYDAPRESWLQPEVDEFVSLE